MTMICFAGVMIRIQGSQDAHTYGAHHLTNRVLQ